MGEDETCMLSLAGDMMMMVMEGIFKKYEGAEKVQGEVKQGELRGVSSP
jgi:hypothetical protein